MGNANIRKGIYGEQQAVRFLEKLGHQILELNWKYRRKEIDIISCCHLTLHFTEVKTRFDGTFGTPELAVDAAKLNRIKLAATAYLEEHPQWKRISFDILAIDLQGGHSSIRHFQDLS